MLKADNISLRLLIESDLNFLYSIENDPLNNQFTNQTNYFSKETLREYISNSNADISKYSQIRFVITLDNDPIGLIDLFEYNQLLQQAGIGIFISKDFRSNKYGAKALALLISYSWNSLDLLFLFANIKKENIISIALFKKLGFLHINNNLYQLNK